MRIFPALWVMLALTVLVVGPLLSTLGAKAYLSSPATWHYLVKGATLFDNVAFHLPGVFAQNRYPDAVNGSLWSLPVEVRMYLVIALLWLLCGIARRWHSRLFSTACIAIVLTAGGLVLATHLQGLRDSAALRLIFMFFSGATFFVLRDFLRISRLAFALSTAALLGATFAGHQVFFVVYLLALPYVVIFLAYVPAGGIRRFNRLGDYSYGVYIYAFPVQQVIVALQPGVSVAMLLLQAAAVALVLAGLSWHLVEKRTLASPRPNSPLPATADVVVTHATANRADELGAPARAIAETTPT